VSASKAVPDVREPLTRAVEAARHKDFGAALGHLKSLLATDPRNVVALGMLAGIYAEIKMADRAESCYLEVLEIDPTNILARYQLGLLKLQTGRAREAIDAWEPSLRDPADYLAHFHSALAYAALGENTRARELLDQAARYMPATHALCAPLRDLRQKLTDSIP